MRVSVSDYGEARDCLAQDWIHCLADLVPELDWLPIPNAGAEGVTRFAERWGLDAILLTGGNDLGERPERDESERALLDLARARHLPLLAVCRGLQLLNRAGGGSLAPCGPGHVAHDHELISLDPALGQPESAFRVNSFHNHGIPREGLAPGLVPCATTPDGAWVEAARSAEGRCWGIMWHPERPNPAAALDRSLVRLALGVDTPQETDPWTP